ncbi:P-loop NTPase family protein [Tsukamurella soli]
MSAVVDLIRPGALVLCNESFSTTNFREGAAIGAAVVRALRDGGVTVVYVTHMFDLVDAFAADPGDTLFLRAERRPDGARTFRVCPEPASETSHAEDVFRRIFGVAP